MSTVTPASLFDLQKHLRELEDKAKRLRDDVKRLEATKTALGASDALVALAEHVRQECEEGNQAVTINSAVSSKRRRQLQQQQQAKRLVLHQDFVDELAHKAGGVSATVAKHRALVREKEVLMATLENATARAEEEEQQYIALSELVDADSDEHSAVSIGIKKHNAYMHALNELIPLYRTRDTVREHMDAQSAELQRIAGMAQETSNAEEQREQARAVLAEKEEQLRQLRAEGRKTVRAVKAKDEILVKKSRDMTEEEKIHSVNYTRRVAMHELDKEHEQIKINDQSIRYRAMEIAKAEKRLELVGDAVAGAGLSEEERVDVELVDTLITEVDALYNLQTEANIRADQLDATVELMEFRGSAMERTTDGTRKEMERIKKEHERFLKTVREEVSAEQKSNDREVAALEREIDHLRGDLSSHRSAGSRQSRRSGTTNTSTAQKA